MQAIKVYNLREVDELVFFDVSATKQGRRPDFELVDELADECFMPLTVGGGIRCVDDVARLLAVGADKVALGTALVEEPQLVSAVAAAFGSQCVVAVIDVKADEKGTQWAWVRSGDSRTDWHPVELAVWCEANGAGEILLQSIDRDGTMTGYDVDLVKAVSAAVSVPVIASGGAGTFEHLISAINEGGASAVAAASMFHFTEQTPLEAKHRLGLSGVPVRRGLS
jgi:cyclase